MQQTAAEIIIHFLSTLDDMTGLVVLLLTAIMDSKAVCRLCNRRQILVCRMDMMDIDEAYIEWQSVSTE